MMLELEMEGRAVGLQLGLGDGSTWTLEEIEPTFQGGDKLLEKTGKNRCFPPPKKGGKTKEERLV